MPYLLLGLLVLVGIYFIFRGLRGTNPRNLQKTLAIVVGIVAVTVLGFFAVSGRMGYFGWAMLALPLLLRWRAISQAMRNMRGPTPGKNSDIETAYLRMTLDHDSGVLSGTVLQGQFEGRNLEELSREDLLDLLRLRLVCVFTCANDYSDVAPAGSEPRDPNFGIRASCGIRTYALPN